MAERYRILLVDDEPSIVKMVGKRRCALFTINAQELLEKIRALLPTRET